MALVEGEGTRRFDGWFHKPTKGQLRHSLDLLQRTAYSGLDLGGILDREELKRLEKKEIEIRSSAERARQNHVNDERAYDVASRRVDGTSGETDNPFAIAAMGIIYDESSLDSTARLADAAWQRVLTSNQVLEQYGIAESHDRYTDPGK